MVVGERDVAQVGEGGRVTEKAGQFPVDTRVVCLERLQLGEDPEVRRQTPCLKPSVVAD
jgi:hypothetical protein